MFITGIQRKQIFFNIRITFCTAGEKCIYYTFVEV